MIEYRKDAHRAQCPARSDAGQRAGMKALIIAALMITAGTASANLVFVPSVIDATPFREEVKKMALSMAAYGYFCREVGIQLDKCQSDLREKLDKADQKTQ